MARSSAETSGSVAPADRLALAGHRIYAWFIAFAGVGGLITCVANNARGLTDPVMVIVGAAGSVFCLVCSVMIFVLPKYRRHFILISGAVLYGILIFLSLDAEILVSSPAVYMTALVVSTTFVLGPRASFLGLIATLVTYFYLYLNHHADDVITPAGGSFIDWRTLLLLMCAMAILLYSSSVIFRAQMMSLVRSYAEATARAEASGQATSAFLANMSHEIRTPMNGVLGMIDIALATPLPGEARESLLVAQRSATGLIRVLSDVLDLSKLQSSGVQIALEPVDPKALLSDTAQLFSASAEAKGLKIRLETNELPETVLLDSGRTAQVLGNLIGNAIKFTDAGQIQLSAHYQNGQLTYQVEDTGIGMPEAFLPHVFGRFQQAEDRLAERRGGTGLGLAICQELTQLMGGSISVTSIQGEGTTFTVVLPAPVEASGATAPSPAAPAASSQDADRALLVLVAEDNPVNQAVVRAFLERLGHRCVVVDDGHAALEALGVDDFDLLLLDISMPGLDGVEVTRRVRALDDPKADVPILMLTAHIGAHHMDASKKAGANGVLHKPLTIDALANALGRYTGAAPGPADQVAEAS